jgi:hypothetical protein
MLSSWSLGNFSSHDALQIERMLNEEEEPTRYYLVFYYTYDRLNMFRTPLCPSSGAHDYTADYQMGRLILRLLKFGDLVQAAWLSVRAEG